MKDAGKFLPKPELGDAWLKFAREQRPKPHILFWAGRWYVQPDRDTTFAIASGATVRSAWASYQLIEYEIETSNAITAHGIENPFIPKLIITAWRRLMGNM